MICAFTCPSSIVKVTILVGYSISEIYFRKKPIMPSVCLYIMIISNKEIGNAEYTYNTVSV